MDGYRVYSSILNYFRRISDDQLEGSGGVRVALDGGCVDHAVGIIVEQLGVVI